MFCPKCGSILMPKKIEEKVAPKKKGAKKKKVTRKILACPKCDYRSQEEQDAVLKEKIGKVEEVEVIEEEIETLPITDAECPKCKHKKAYFWTLQTRASDEPETKFLKCEKCKNVWRDYS